MAHDERRVLLKAKGLRNSLAGANRLEVGLEVAAGEILEIRGPSGCGKTTLLRMLARLEAREAGTLLLRGRPAEEIRPALWRRGVLYVAQHPVMFEGTVGENLAAGFATRQADPASRDWEKPAAELLRAMLIDPSMIQQDARTLSGGEAARVGLCRALLIEPSILLADEPTASLDVEAATAVARVLKEWVVKNTAGDRALVLVAHDAAPWEGLDRQILRLSKPTGRHE